MGNDRYVAQDDDTRNAHARALARKKLTWLQECLRVSPGAYKLAALLALVYLNRQVGWAWPAQETLAARLGASARQVRRWLEELTRAGLLEIERGERNRYRPIFDSVSASEDRTPMSGSTDADRTPMSGQSGHTRPVQTGHPCPPNPLRGNPPEEPPTHQHPHGDVVSRRARARPPDDEGFEEFWRQYPNQVGQDGARREFRIIVGDGRATPAELQAAAMRYAAATTGMDPQYIKNPDRWLRAGHWRDPPPSARTSPTRNGNSNGHSHARDASRRGIMNFLERQADHERQES